jgi:phage gp36-like protein
MIVPKNPSSILDLDVNYTNQLAIGETIVSATAAVVGSASITVGATPTITGPLLTCRVSGGTDGHTDAFLVLATTSTGEVLDATVYVAVSVGIVPSSYSTPERLAARISPKIYADLTADTGTVPDDSVGQAMLDAAATEINVRIGNRYATPVTAPPVQLTRLAGIEEPIAYWMLWVRKGFSEDDPAAKAAYNGADRAYKLLDDIAKGVIDLPGVALRLVVTTGTTGAGWKSNTPVYTNENFRMF